MVHIASEIERSIENLNCNVDQKRLLAVAQHKTKGADDLTVRYSVSAPDVYAALSLLKLINPLYKNVKLENFRSCLPDDPELIKIDVCDSVALVDLQGVCPLDRSLGIKRELETTNDGIWSSAEQRKKFQTEEKAYPHLFPTGCNGEFMERPTEINSIRYYQNRLRCLDNRFQADTTYIFRSFNIVQKHYVDEAINFALRDAGKYVSGVE
jgi:hypothetical protein